MDRRRMLNAFVAASELADFDEFPVLTEKSDLQVYLSRNTVPQPFFLICEKDCVMAQLSGTARMEFRESSVNRFAMGPGDMVYIPAGTPHRVTPHTESVQLRYKPRENGLEGVAWYCESCDAEIQRFEWDTNTTVPQAAYLASCEAFNGDPALRTCPSCSAAHPEVDYSAPNWARIAEELESES